MKNIPYLWKKYKDYKNLLFFDEAEQRAFDVFRKKVHKISTKNDKYLIGEDEDEPILNIVSANGFLHLTKKEEKDAEKIARLFWNKLVVSVMSYY